MDSQLKTSTKTVKLSQLFAVFFKIGVLSFGGGLSGWIYRDVVTRRRWMTAQAFLAGMTLAQVLPGANVANIAIYIGDRIRGPLGALVAVTAVLVGPFFVILALAEAFLWLKQFDGFDDFLDGVAAAAIGLLLVVGMDAGRIASKQVRSAVVFLLVFTLIGVLNAPLIITVAVVGVLSVCWCLRTER
ncbi:chromate transporter [Ensifer adhaerens]|uniref:Chromate transporter n=1 Tax=Ensifer adhaerens TaxID=106592 RepID=A0A9Q8YGD0_ENSAD|nr:chromate transporter [Ensifer adhaerens]USJ28408.1 chromate transporter [Ensifer adhaerens]